MRVDAGALARADTVVVVRVEIFAVERAAMPVTLSPVRAAVESAATLVVERAEMLAVEMVAIPATSRPVKAAVLIALTVVVVRAEMLAVASVVIPVTSRPVKAVVESILTVVVVKPAELVEILRTFFLHPWVAFKVKGKHVCIEQASFHNAILLAKVGRLFRASSYSAFS